MRIRALAGICAVVVAAAICTLAAQSATPTGDGRLRSELSLSGRTVTVAFAPDAKAQSGPIKMRGDVGQFEIAGAVRIGSLDLGTNATDPSPAAPSVLRYPFVSESSPNGWRLLVSNSEGALIGGIVLERHALPPPSPNLVAALEAESFTTARLVLRQGGFEAAVPVEVVNPPRRRLTENPGVNQTINRRHDDDTSVLSRARLLEQRNETALTLPKGARVSISFQRSFAAAPRTNARGLTVDRVDFRRLGSTPVGSVVLLTEAPVARMRTEVPLSFGKTTIATGNQVVGFPGSYGLWLKRVANGWRLVFNHEPDAWGSQHNAKFDAAEIDLVHSDGHDATRPFAVNVIPESAERGRLMILWGPHEWTANFSVAN